MVRARSKRLGQVPATGDGRAAGGVRWGVGVLAAAVFGAVGFVAPGAAAPAYADAPDSSDGSDIPPPKNQIVAQASASAATVSLAGQKQGTGEYVSEHDGTEEHTRGENEPMLALLEDAEHVVGGGLGQDAESNADGTSAACAGVVGSNGTIEVGPHQSCLDGDGGRIELSLGTLSDLGLGDLLDQLRLPSSAELVDPDELPTPGDLPDMELVLEGRAITARCTATPTGAEGSSGQLDLTLVGALGDQRIELLDVPSEGGSILLSDLLDPLTDHLPGELTALLEPLLRLLASGDLPDVENELLTIVTDEQVEADGQLRVNALRVAVLPPTLTEVSVGSVTCGPNVEPTSDRPAPPDEQESNEPEDKARVPVSVPAGLPPSDPTADAANSTGWGAAAVLGLAGLALGGLLHRRRGTSRGALR